MFGIISALGAASSWTYACYLWRQQTKYFSASQVNIIKKIIAFFIFSPTIFTFDFKSSSTEILILLISGIIGIAIGDTFYIKSLRALGTRRTLTIEALSPIFAMVLGSLFLKEMLPLKALLGILLISISLKGVAVQKTVNHSVVLFETEKKKGFIFAFISVICAVTAATLSRYVLINSGLNPFQTTEIRLLGGTIALLPFMRANLIQSVIKLPLEPKIRLLYATFLGTNIGILLQQNVFQVLPIGLGWTLLSTSPLISLFFARAEGEKINWKTLLFTITSILGIFIAFI